MTTKPDPASCHETGADCGDECIADPSSFRVATAGHNLVFYPLGQERIDVLVALIDGARTSLHAFYFAFEPDKVGVRVRDALDGALSGAQPPEIRHCRWHAGDDWRL